LKDEIVVVVAMWAVLSAFIWECAWFIKKKLFPVQIGDTDAPCVCGSATTQVEGRRTHYTATEFNARLERKYNRRGSKYRVKAEALQRMRGDVMTNASLLNDPEWVGRYESLRESHAEERDRLLAKYARKWVQCIRCGATSRRSYMSPEVQSKVDWIVQGPVHYPNAFTEAIIHILRMEEEE